ncbi:MAG: tRNA (adenosine(37)-N6)-threonylcarbamoyltransferase complex dimerization subunit type 1 TsaB [Burkholderiales bacterium]
MNLLAIDTSTDFCSVAASRGRELFSRHEPAAQRQAEMILGMIDAVLAEAGLEFARIDGIAFGAGPGSFTGLRIAAGVAQGLALARGLGVVGVGTLFALADSVAEESGDDRIVACLDAHRGEVYHAAYRKVGGEWEEVSAPGLYDPDGVPVVSGGAWTGCGSGFAVHGDRLSARLADCVSAVRPGASPTARSVLRLAMPRFAAGEAADAAAAVPVYLRDRVALKTGERR